MNTSLERAKALIEARATNRAEALRIEEMFAEEHLTPEMVAHDTYARQRCHADHANLSPMEATEAFAAEVQRGFSELAVVFEKKLPRPGKYNLLFATTGIIRDIWRARQVVDETGIPYPFYMSCVVEQRAKSMEPRTPRATQFVQPDALSYVMRKWASRTA